MIPLRRSGWLNELAATIAHKNNAEDDYEQDRAADFVLKRQLYYAFSCWDDQINECLALIETEAGLKTPFRMHAAAELARQISNQNKTLTVYDTQLRLGHSSFKTTEAYYRDSADQDTSESMKAVFGRGKVRRVSYAPTGAKPSIKPPGTFQR
ncbi:hypothetical protein [Spirosoma sp. KUDC1026]|uniref:hypothetical protein n=1 Tax=Spirosoma sp. KUDC1026 TaxID=2745947 RepID=UPI00159BB1AD|nr:hypothetical protein [Spirosoma sp. KUDC1026]QKZ14337.1 hypothetical protein HU175_17560 [Spirosoma sp. KUDC1026]